jgi:hypothetical protein
MDRRTDNACGIQRSNERVESRDSLLRVGDEPALACHLGTTRTLYSHHGIYVGNGRVIHYAGLSHGWRRGPVENVSLEYFAHGRGIRVRQDRPRVDRREVVARARSRLGERRYGILTNNYVHPLIATNCARTAASHRSSRLPTVIFIRLSRARCGPA